MHIRVYVMRRPITAFYVLSILAETLCTFNKRLYIILILFNIIGTRFHNLPTSLSDDSLRRSI